MQMLKYYKWVT